MTSFTKALYNRDPAAAEAFHRAQTFEQRMLQGRPGTLSYGRSPTLQQFTPAFHEVKRVFGKRGASPRNGPTQVACAASCGHPACKQGCTLIGQFDVLCDGDKCGLGRPCCKTNA